MKITYATHVNINVRYDGAFDYRVEDCPLIDVRATVEEQMWDHSFKVADIIDPDTGEVLVTIEKSY